MLMTLSHVMWKDIGTERQQNYLAEPDRLGLSGEKLRPPPDPVKGALSLVPPRIEDEVVGPPLPSRRASLFSRDQPAQMRDGSGNSAGADGGSWKAAVEAYKRIDPNADRTKVEEGQYQDLQNKLEAEVRRQLGDLTSYMNQPADGKVTRQPDGYDLGSRYRSTDDSEGKACNRRLSSSACRKFF